LELCGIITESVRSAEEAGQRVSRRYFLTPGILSGVEIIAQKKAARIREIDESFSLAHQALFKKRTYPRE